MAEKQTTPGKPMPGKDAGKMPAPDKGGAGGKPMGKDMGKGGGGGKK